MSEQGFASLVDELINRDYSPNELSDAVCAKLYQQLFDHFVLKLAHLGDFDGVRHEQIRDKYRALDEKMGNQAGYASSRSRISIESRGPATHRLARAHDI